MTLHDPHHDPVPRGGRRVEVSPDRLPGWLERFTAAHGPLTWSWHADDGRDEAAAHAEDGTVVAGSPLVWPAGVADPRKALLTARTPPVLGLLLVRRGGFAAGVVADGTLVGHRTGTRHVQGRTAAGGWSQQRFARRREGQARVLVEAAVGTARRVLREGEHLPVLVVTGGDRTLLREVLEDAALRGLTVADRVLDVPDPRLDVLRAAASSAVAVRLRVLDPQ